MFSSEDFDNNMKKLITAIIILSACSAFGQKSNSENWIKSDSAQYKNLKGLASYIYQKKKIEISKDSLFKNYIYFDNVLNDTDIKRRDKRIAAFDTLFYFLRKTVDSIGLANLDAKPVRFYKNHKIYEPFDKEKSGLKTLEGEKVYAKDDNVFAYYRKDEPDSPLGVLLFEAESGKLCAWIMIDQGGHRYFLTFNLM